MSIYTITAVIVATLIGIGVGYALRRVVLLSQKSTLEIEVKERKLAAKEKAAKIKETASKRAEEIKKQAKEQASEIEKKIAEEKQILNDEKKELKEKSSTLAQKRQDLEAKSEDLQESKAELKNQQAKLRETLAEVAGMDPAEAKKMLLAELQDEHAEEIQARRKKLQRHGKKELERRANELMAGVLQRLSRSVDPEILSTKVSLKDDSLKGKIIGKDGRNIHTFQQVTGVELVIDETPNVITISSYDPIRRAVAKYALDDLLEDGRVQPARIERFVSDAKKQVNNIIKDKGESAAAEVRLLALDERIIAMLGRLHFRTSYGQNVLQHSIEAAHIAEMLAHELDADAEIAKAGALLHDIGKAADHELTGSHVEIGIHILKKFGAEEAVIDAMKSHHDNYPHESLEAVIVQVADGISGARPGARKQSIESYIERLEELENIALNFQGVVNSYAIEAGREVRVFVNSDQIDDPEARRIAKEIATRIENRMSYPGEVKVHVIRETRLTHYAR